MPEIPASWTSATTTSAGGVRRCSSAAWPEVTASTSKPRFLRESLNRIAVSSSSSTIRMGPFSSSSYLSAANHVLGGRRLRSERRPATTRERDDCQDERNDKDDLRDTRGRRRDPEEAEERCNQRDDEEGDCPGKHR